jgi:thiosulfate/3-mercaptopyruvate sulfurtransferase
MHYRHLLLCLAVVAAACAEPSASVDPVEDPGERTLSEGVGIVEASSLPEDVQIVDARPLDAFREAHPVGAVHLDASTLRTTVDGVDGQVVPRSTFDGLLAPTGLEPVRPIAVIGAGNDTATARVFWTLAFHGAGDLALVDGGVDAWVDAGGQLVAGDPEARTGGWDGEPTRAELRVDLDWMVEHLDDPDVRLFDVRTPDEYAAGHIPGAVNVDWTRNLRDDGRFRTRDAILALHDEPTAPTVVVYCQSGARASVSWSVLHDAGLPDVRLYDGSWNEWGVDPDTPKVEGATPR